jgi:large conductance mechanosensitive channel
MIKEFREFIMRGNVLDLAVAFIIGAAFTAIVTSLVNDVIMPVIGLVLAGIDFSAIVITLREASGDNPAVTINIGTFINAVIQFLIIAFVVFLLVKSINEMARRARREKDVVPEEPAAPTVDEQMLANLERMNATLEKMERKA